MCYRCARPEGTRARLLNALPLRYMSAFTKRSGKNVRFVRFYPPPLSITIRRGTSCLRLRRPSLPAGGQGVHLKIFWRKTLMEGPSQKIFKNGGWLCLTDAQRYYTTLQFWQVTGSADGVYPGYLAHFSPYFVSYAGCGRDARDPRGICNNLGCTPLTGGIPDHWGDLPDHWRLRPGRWVWPHLTDNQLTCTHNNPGYTRPL